MAAMYSYVINYMNRMFGKLFYYVSKTIMLLDTKMYNNIIHPSCHIILAGITSAVLRNNKAIDKVSAKKLVIPF